MVGGIAGGVGGGGYGGGGWSPRGNGHYSDQPEGLRTPPPRPRLGIREEREEANQAGRPNYIARAMAMGGPLGAIDFNSPVNPNETPEHNEQAQIAALGRLSPKNLNDSFKKI